MRPCSRLLALAACISTSGGLTGCAYVEYRRTYALSVSVPETERAPLSDALDHFFAQRGLVLKQKYRDLYPRNVLASAFEIPRTRADDRRDPLLFVTTSDNGLVQLIQSEWYFDTKREPEDLVALAKPELLKAITATIGGKPNLIFDPRGAGGRSP
jgi:hypothetical protein